MTTSSGIALTVIGWLPVCERNGECRPRPGRLGNPIKNLRIGAGWAQSEQRTREGASMSARELQPTAFRCIAPANLFTMLESSRLAQGREVVSSEEGTNSFRSDTLTPSVPAKAGQVDTERSGFAQASCVAVSSRSTVSRAKRKHHAERGSHLCRG